MDHPSGRKEDSVLFRPQDQSPGMLGQRNTDSVLFKAAQLEPVGRPRAPAAADGDGSGLVDVAALVEPSGDGPLVEPKAALVTEIESRSPLPIDEPAPQPHGIVLATIVVT